MFVIVSMVTDRLAERLGSEPILPVSVNLTEMGTETVRVNGHLYLSCEVSRLIYTYRQRYHF